MTNPDDAGMDVDVVDEQEYNQLKDMWTKNVKEEAEVMNREILKVVELLGGSGNKYKKERKKAMQHMVAEIFSPPRVTAAAKMLPSLGCIPGFALDLTTSDANGTPWDFDCPRRRAAAWELLETDKPMLVIGPQYAQPGVLGSISTVHVTQKS